MAIQPDAGTMHPLRPGVEVVLRLRQIALVVWRDADIGLADRHGALGERSIYRVLRGGAQPDPLVAETAFDAVLNHRFQQVSGRLVAYPVQQSSTHSLLLHSNQNARLIMMHSRQAILDKLLRHKRHTVGYALLLLRGGEAFQLSGLGECGHSPIGHPAVELALLIFVIGATIRIGGVVRDSSPLEGLPVVTPAGAAAMRHADRVLRRDLTQPP